MRGLLDVNVLVALLDRQHVAHARAHLWLSQHLTEGWASCPLTENGCLRVLTNPRYPAPLPAADVLAKLETAKSSGHQEFWPDDLSVTDSAIFERGRFSSHQQVTDAYLLALAIRHAGRLVTFDTAFRLTLSNAPAKSISSSSERPAVLSAASDGNCEEPARLPAARPV